MKGFERPNKTESAIDVPSAANDNESVRFSGEETKVSVEEAQAEILAYLKSGIRADLIKRMAVQYKVPEHFMQSREVMEAAQEGLEDSILQENFGQVKEYLKEFPDDGAMIGRILESRRLHSTVDHYLARGGRLKLDMLKESLGLDSLEGLELGAFSTGKLASEISTMGNTDIAIGTVRDYLAAGISPEAIETAFIHIYSKDPKAFSLRADEFIAARGSDLPLTARFYNDPGVKEQAKARALSHSRYGHVDDFLSTRSTFALDIPQEEFEANVLAGIETNVDKMTFSPENEEKVRHAGYTLTFLLESPSSGAVKDEGFEASTDESAANSELFAAMRSGEFKVIPFTPDEIIEDVTRTGRARSVLYKAPDGATLEKDLSHEDWSVRAAHTLTQGIRLKRAPREWNHNEKQSLVADRELQRTLPQRGFELKEKIRPILQTYWKAIRPGTFTSFAYMPADILAHPEKEGQSQQILYKTLDGRLFHKTLESSETPIGWPHEDARAFIAGLEESVQHLQSR